ncbi:MAG: InlB B-repeat-containing protein, partial [Kiritimatiellae bacterium]|nr:InlB B-repeat-containing protein [Kiritimatiellia bacterium]
RLALYPGVHGGGGGGSGGNGGYTYKGNYGTGNPSTPDGAGGEGGKDNGESAGRSSPDTTHNGDTTYNRGGYRGSGGASGGNNNGGNTSLYRDSDVTLNASYYMANSATTHSAIEYQVTFQDGQRINESRTARLAYAYPTAPIPPARAGWTFHGWFTGANGTGTKYYDASGTAQAQEWTTIGDLTLHAHWTLADEAAASRISINGTGLVGGVSKSGTGWSYNGADGRLSLTSAGTFVITGADNYGEFSVHANANCTVVMSNLTMNASIAIARPPFESVSGKTTTLQFKGTNTLTGCSGHPAVYVAEGSTVTINGDGTVTATGGANAPGIGGMVGETSGTGKLTIDGCTIVANGGEYGSGIGAAKGSGFGTVTITGGTITATGQESAAGIGGSQGAGMGTYVISGGTVNARGGYGGAGIGSGRNAIGGTVRITGGTVTAHGGYYAPGIGVGENSSGGTVEITGGTVTATGVRYGAGIGGGNSSTFTSISISGGTVTAFCDNGGACCASGIGSGYNGKGGTIRISGGVVKATGGGDYGAGIGAGDAGVSGFASGVAVEISGGFITAACGSAYAACIGSADYAACGTITISGGTINATVPPSAFRTIGKSTGSYNSCGAVTIAGGAVYSPLAKISPAPSNTASKAVFPIDFAIGEATNKVTAFTLSGALAGYAYGATDLCTDTNGTLRAWLPSTAGEAFVAGVTMAGGNTYYFSFGIDDGGAVSVRGFLVVNGQPVASNADNSGTGWSFAKSNGVVTISANADIQGLSTNGEFRIDVPADSGASSVSIKNLTLTGLSARYASAMAFGRDASLAISGSNVFAAAGQYAAGVEVASNAVLTISGRGSLAATGGKNAAGIGSRGGNAPPGKIRIQSGTVTGQGGEKAAGIGGGLSAPLDKADNIVVEGGIVRGIGGTNAPGIGAGHFPNGAKANAAGAVRIAGGSVEASWGGGSTGSDLIRANSTISATGDEYAFSIRGGSVVPDHGANHVAPRPVDAESNLLYAVRMGGFTPGAEVAVSCAELPDGYTTDGIAADSRGRVCIWMAATNKAHVVVAGGQYFTTPYPYTNTTVRPLYKQDVDFAADGGSDVPPEDLPPSDPSDTNILHRVTVPGLEPGADVTLEIQAVTTNLVSTADSEGRYFFYVADGDYAFKANSLDYAVRVAGGPATAFRTDPSNPTGVTVDGTDVCAGIGLGWTYDMQSSNLVLSAGAPVLAGSNTEGRVNATIAADMTLTAGGLTLSGASAKAAIALEPGVTATLALAGGNTLLGGYGLPAVGVPAGASLEISGDGALDATGGRYAAGIGTGDRGTGGTIAISGGTVNAVGGASGAGIGAGSGGTNGTIVISGGTVTATGNANSSGIGASGAGAGGTISITGGTVTANGGMDGAGIGGGYGSPVDSITIGGGTVTATGGSNAAGIGTGNGGTVGSIAVTGGAVTATGGSSGAGIGGGQVRSGGSGGIVDTIAISGGTVTAQGGDNASDIGRGRAVDGGSTLFTGGSIHALADTVSPAPSNGTARVWCVTVPGLAPDAAVTGLAGLPDYNTDGIVADAAGQIYLWLPDGTHVFEIDGVPYGAYVDGADATAERIVPYGVLVDGRDVSELSGEGWTYDWGTRQLLLSGDSHVLAGSNTEGRVWVVVSNDMALAARDLVLAFTNLASASHPVIALAPGVSASLALEGSNSLHAIGMDAAVNVPAGTSLTISGDGSLLAEAANAGAAIGGNEKEAAGRIEIASGTVAARSWSGAGIGGGHRADGGEAAISGGTVTAISRFGAGIGGGSGDLAMSVPGGAGGTVEISGGLVSVSAGVPDGTGVGDSAGIGGGSFGAAAHVTVTGGTVVFTDFGPAIAPPFAVGSGYFPDYAPIGPGTNVIAGGSVVVTNVAKMQGGATDAAGVTVWPVTFAGLAPGATIAFADFERDGAPAAYGTSGIVADASGTVVLWLPNGTYTGTVDGTAFWAVVDDAPATARLDLPTGVYVDGTDVQAASGDGWSYDFMTGWLVVSNGDHVVSGTNTEGRVVVAVTNTLTLAVSNLTLAVGAETELPAFVVRPNATATLRLHGENSLRGGKYNAAVEVPLYASLTVTGTGTLAATGGYHGAAIGGRSMNTCGRITLSGGTIFPVAGETAPAIGRGAQSYSGGFVHFTGGSVVVDRDAVVPAPSNTVGQAVWPVTVEGLEPGAPVAIAVSPGSYGTDGIVADPAGKIVLWLPNGFYDLDVGGTAYVASVHDAGDTAEPAGAPVGVLADGVDLKYRHGANWTFTATNGELAVEGSCTVSGSNTARRIHLHLANDSRVTCSNLAITSGSTVVLDPGTRATLRGIGFNNMKAVGDYAIWGGSGAQATIESGTFSFGGGYMSPRPVIRGGSVYGSVFGNEHATDGTRDVWRVTAGGFGAYAPVALEGLPAGYDVSEIHADASGNIYLWLPDGTYSFTADGAEYLVRVDGAYATAEPYTPRGVTVDGTDVGRLSGPGRSYHPGTKHLAVNADCVISGTNDAGAVSVRVAADCAVTCSNLCLRLAGTTGAYSPVLLGDGVSATLLLSGSNTLWAGSGSAAVGVPTSTALTVAGDGILDASGAYTGAGIGGWNTTGCGTVAIESGILLLARGAGAACIGGGERGAGGDVAISGGTVLLREYTSYPVPYAIGRGRNSSGADGTLTITGGSLGELPRSTASHALPLDLLGSAPTNAAGAPVYSVAITNLAPNAPVAFSNLPASYGTDSIVADAFGNVFLWLPDGDYTFTAGGATWDAAVAGGSTAAVRRAVAAPGGASPLSVVPSSLTYDPSSGAVTFTVTADTPEELDAALQKLTIRTRTSLLDDAPAATVPHTATRTRSGATATLTVPFDTGPSTPDSIRFYFLETAP